MRITCKRCGKDRMLSETHTPPRDMLIRDIIARMRHDGCGGRAGQVELLTGTRILSIPGLAAGDGHSSGPCATVSKTGERMTSNKRSEQDVFDELEALCALPGVGGGENPRINGAETVTESMWSSHRAALGSGGPAVTGNQPSLLMVKDGCPATLCKRWPTAPAFGGCRR